MCIRDRYLFKCNNIVEFDVKKRQTRFEEFNEECQMHNSIAGARPIYLNVNSQIEDGFFRTDVMFGSGYEQSPIIIIGCSTYSKMKSEKFSDMDFEPIEMKKTE